MDKRIHFIWGSPSHSKNRIHLLKMNGMQKIIVLDKNQQNMVRESNDVTYFPVNLIPFLKIDQPDKVHHFFMRIPSEKNRNKVKKD